MEKHIKLNWILVALIALVACNINDKAETNSFQVKGRYNKFGLESGYWKYFDGHGQIIEEGDFDNGLRSGVWFYYDVSKGKDSIRWSSYENTDGTIKTNIPDNLILLEENDSVAVFKSRDPAKFFNLAIGKGSQNFFDSYREVMYNELSENNVVFKDTLSQYIVTETGKKYLYNNILGADSQKKFFYLFNITGSDSSNNLVEVTLRCDTSCADLARRVFFSVVPNLFTNSSRFLPLKETIKDLENSASAKARQVETK